MRSRALQLLATTRYAVGGTAEAITLQRSALEMRERLDPEDVELLANLRNALAFFLIRGGAYAEALVEVDRALAVLREGSPRARIEAAYGLRLRANALDSLDRDREAEDDLLAALKIREELFDDENSPALADLLNDLGQVELDRNKVDLAQTHALRALEIRRARLGEHRDTATALTLATVARRQKDLAASVGYNEEALAMRRRLFDASSPAIGELPPAARGRAVRRGEPRGFREAAARSGRELEQQPGRCTSRRRHRAPGARPHAATAARLRRGHRAVQRGARPAAVAEVRPHVVADARGARSADRSAHGRRGLDRRAGDHRGRARGRARRAAQGRASADLPRRAARRDADHAGVATSEAEELLLAGWKAMGERKDLFAENKLFLLDHLVRLYVTLGDEDAAERYRVLAAGLRGPFDSR